MDSELSRWIITTEESHPWCVVGSIFKVDDKERIVARVIRLAHGNTLLWRGFVCGKSSLSNKYTQCYYDRVFDVENDSLYSVVFILDLKLLEMGYKIKDIGRFI